jgi:hypothetical protein
MDESLGNPDGDKKYYNANFSLLRSLRFTLSANAR